MKVLVQSLQQYQLSCSVISASDNFPPPSIIPNNKSVPREQVRYWLMEVYQSFSGDKGQLRQIRIFIQYIRKLS